MNDPPASPLGAAITGIDHLLVGVRDLETACRIWTRLGFTLTPRGRHIGWGTANFCIMSPDDYIELLGIVDPGRFVNRLDLFLERHGEGLMSLAFATDDPDSVAAGLVPAGLAEPPQDLARLLELPEGDVTPRFSLVHLRPETTPSLPAFVCRHLTPDLLRRPEWLDHDNGAVGLDGVTLCVRDPAAAAPAYARLFGDAALAAEPGRLDVAIGRHRLRLLTPERLAQDYAGMVLTGPQAGLCAMSVRCRDLSATRSHLESEGIPLHGFAGSRLVVPPVAATGVLVEFTEAAESVKSAERD